MPRNVFFSQGTKSEQNLVEDLVIEALKIYGFELYYLPRNMVSRDLILNEDIESRFDEAYMIEMYIENTEGFGGDGIFMSKFGLQIREQATFVVSKKQWSKLVGVWNNGIISDRPEEGDLLYFPLTKSFFDIKFVEHQSPFYQLTQVPVFKLQCELFEYNNEVVDTGNSEVDKLEQNFSTETYLQISGSGQKFTIGEMVTQTLSPATETSNSVEIYGKVLRYIQEVSTDPLKVAIGEISTNTGEYGMFQASSGSADALVGQKSGVAWSITRVYDIADTDTNLTFVNNDRQAQNRDFEVQGNSVIDFSESNPFGEVNFVESPPVISPSYGADSIAFTADSTILTADTQE